MFISFQGNNNATVVSKIEMFTGNRFINKECFKGKENGHKFKSGDNLELFGLTDYPQFNGEIVEITAIREDGSHGKAYYFKTDNPELAAQLNWTYEYRLRNS